LKVSIITVVLSNKKYIADAINSVLSQSHKDIEYIIIDGGSTDGTVEIIRSYGDKITKFISQSDKGVYYALNKGVELATGDIVGLLHSDDYYVNNKVISQIVEAFERQNCDAVYTNLFYVSNTNSDKIIRIWDSGSYSESKFYYGWMPPHPAFFVKREVYEKNGAFNTELNFAADYELMFRFIFKNKIKVHYIPKFLVKMRVGGASNRNIWNRIKANIEDRKAWTINGSKPKFYTLLLKPFSKIFQYKFIS